MRGREFEFAEVNVSAEELDLLTVVEVEERNGMTTLLFRVEEGEGQQVKLGKPGSPAAVDQYVSRERRLRLYARGIEGVIQPSILACENL